MFCKTNKQKNHTALTFVRLLFQLNLFPNLVPKLYFHLDVHASKTGDTKADTRAQAGDPMEAKSCLQGINSTAAGCITIAQIKTPALSRMLWTGFN